MGTPVGTALPKRVTGNRGACLDWPVYGSAVLRRMPLQPHPEEAWAEPFPVAPASPAKAREASRRFLGNCQGMSADTADAAILIVSELVTNAYAAMTETTDGTSGIELSLRWFHNRRLLVEVTDSSPRVPVLATGGPDSVNGRGLALVDALTQQWGFFWHHGQKVVYAVMSQCHLPG